MKQNHKRILDAISELDDGVVDRVSEKRFSLWVKLQERIKRRRARLIGASVGAAALAACVLILALLLPLLSFPGGGGGAGTGDGTDSGNGVPILPDPRQIPIYQGMTVSDKAPIVSTQAWIEDGSFLLSAKGDIHGHRPVIDKDKPFGQAKKDVEETIKDSLNITASSDERYYAAKNSDIYITVHLSNPDKFEILSFTLNGEKYSNYMFEAGSDLENLILKVNTGNRDGIVQYTIDAIKYVDGTEIKDVRMEGERTVDVVITPENQPTAALTLTPAFHSITASVKVTDALGLVEDGEKIGVYAYLYDGDTLVGEKKLKVGENTVTFEGIASNTLYEIAVVGVYDALDGKGVAIHLLSKDAVYTEAYVLFDEVKLQGTTLSFRLLWNEKTEVRVLSSLALYWEGGKIKDLPLDATEITELTSEESYSIIGTYTADGETVTIQLDFITEKLHSVSFVTNGGAALGTKMLSAKEALPVPEREGFTFGGWYRDVALLERVETVPAGGGTLYAHWEGEARPGAFVFEDGVISALTDPNATEVHVPAYIGGVPVRSFELWVNDTTGSNLKKLTVSGETTSVQICNKATLEEVNLPAVGTGDIKISNCTALKTISIPHGVETIASNAFRHCTALESVTLPSTLTSIFGSAFALCTSLKSVTVPGGVTEFDASAFYGCTSLERIVLEEGVVSIWGDFANCTALTELVLPDSLTNIECDFSGAPNLGEKIGDVLCVGSMITGVEDPTKTTYVIPNDGSVTKIAAGAFSACTQLASIEIPTSVTSVSYEAFSGCTGIRSATVPTWALAMIPSEALETLVISGGTGIADSALAGCPALESVVISEGVETIGARAFSDCTSLTSIEIPASVKTVGQGAFYSCIELSEVLLCEGVEHIGDEAFQYCAKIERIEIPASVKTVGGGAFSECTNLSEVLLSEGVESIGAYTFSGCTSLTSIEIPASVKTVGQGAFSSCIELSEVLLCEGVEHIGDEAFRYCAKIERIEIPVSVKTIGNGVFYECITLSQVVLHEGLESIGGYAFVYCYDLTSIEIPASVQSIGDDAFHYAPLSIVYFGGTLAQWNAILDAMEDGEGKTALMETEVVCALNH